MLFSTTVVINCAGIGARMGLGQTKALMDIYGKPLIHWQLEMLSEVKDLRIVVGYQARTLMEVVIQKRRDALFVYNHDYFHTKTAKSLYLGSHYATDLVFSLDGDLLVHPEDMQQCLACEEEFIGYSPSMSEEPVFVSLRDGWVNGFSLAQGDYEWAGPALLNKNKLTAAGEKHLYQVIEEHLPIQGRKVRALDIDTLQDYRNALKVFQQWLK